MMLGNSDCDHEAELDVLRACISEIAEDVAGMIPISICAVLERDSGKLKESTELGQLINRREVEIDGLCFRLLASRKSASSELRFITTALKLVADLERISELCVNICERAIEPSAEHSLAPAQGLPEMAEVAEQMVRQAMQAFVAKDTDLAKRVIHRDRIVDAYYAQICQQLLIRMTHDRNDIRQATHMHSIAKYLERIGDRAANLGEQVVFMLAHGMQQTDRHGTSETAAS